MKIVALTGLTNSGKTMVLRRLIDSLKHDIDYSVLKDVPPVKQNNFEVDGSACFQRKSDNAVIYIATAGDSKEIVQRNIDEALQNSADILVTACHCRTSVTQIPIIDEDIYATFIQVHKYQNFENESSVQQDNYHRKYVSDLRMFI